MKKPTVLDIYYEIMERAGDLRAQKRDAEVRELYYFAGRLELTEEVNPTPKG